MTALLLDWFARHAIIKHLQLSSFGGILLHEFLGAVEMQDATHLLISDSVVIILCNKYFCQFAAAFDIFTLCSRRGGERLVTNQFATNCRMPGNRI